MSIKLNGVEITSNKLNSSNVTLENLDGVKVWPTAASRNEWVYLFASTSSGELAGDIIYITGYFNDDRNLMQDYITSNYPPDNYDDGQVIIVSDYDYDYLYYFQVGQK